MTLPKDPVLLFSYINTQLRDFYSSLEDFCEEKEVDREELTRILAESGYHYDAETNRFS